MTFSSSSLNVRPRLNDVKLAATINPFDVLVSAAKDSFDLDRSAREHSDPFVRQHAALLLNRYFLHAAAFVERQHCVFAGAGQHLNVFSPRVIDDLFGYSAAFNDLDSQPALRVHVNGATITSI